MAILNRISRGIADAEPHFKARHPHVAYGGAGDSIQIDAIAAAGATRPGHRETRPIQHDTTRD